MSLGQLQVKKRVVTCDIDVSALEIGDTIHIKEVQDPENGELVFDDNFTVITVVGHKEEEEEEVAEEEEEETEDDAVDEVEPAAE